MYIITTCKTRCVRLCLFRVYTHWFFLSYNNTMVYGDCRNIIVGKNLKQIEFDTIKVIGFMECKQPR